MNFKDCFLVDDLVIFGGLHRGGYATAAFEVVPQEITNASTDTVNRFGRNLSLFLSSIKDPFRLQLKWGVTSDYSDMLEFYDSETERLKDNASQFSYLTRKEIYGRYQEYMHEGFLRRQRLIIFASVKINTQFSEKDIKSSTRRKEITRNILDSLISQFASFEERMRYTFGSSSTLDRTPADVLKVLFYKYFNRASQLYSKKEIIRQYDETSSVLYSCARTDYTGLNRSIEENYSLVGDNLYQDIIIVSKFPSNFSTLHSHFLTTLSELNYEITVNVLPIDTKKKIREEERLVKQLLAQQQDTSEVGIAHDIDAKTDRILRLKGGALCAFKFEYIIQAWAETKDELISKMEAIKSQLLTMGAEFEEPRIASQAINFLRQSQIAYPWGLYNGFAIDGDSDHARLLPFTSTFIGWDKPEAIYDGNNRNLIGVKNYLSTSQPQHALFLGAVGSGKSSLVVSILTQTEMYFQYSFIVEEGASYPAYAALLGVRPIIMTPNNDLTINYFDTAGLPLTPSHKADIVALLSLMIGVSLDQEYMKLRNALLEHYVDLCYKDFYESWKKNNRDKLDDIIRYLVSADKFKKICPPDFSLKDAFLDLKHARLSKSHKFHKEAKTFYDEVTRQEITMALKGFHATSKDLMSFSIAWWKPEEFPQHIDLLNAMYSHVDNNHDINLVQKLATLLSAYERGGAFGNIFDGVSNVDLKAKLVYFDLAPIGEASKDLKSIITFLITNHVRNYITTLPRSTRKRMIIEEMSKFKDIPGADKLIEEAYSQLRKYGLWVCSIIQQFGQISGHRFADIILGNSSQYFICQQKQLRDIAELGDKKEGIDLPMITQESITSFVNPALLHEADRYASFCYVHKAHKNLIGIARNYCSKEMLWVSSISGEDYDDALKQLYSKENPMEAVWEAVGES
ncbi:MAG: hypothetical protein HRT88_00250 [Lentisphaeraceae bacterium]|nr:hypothetical protein [Lentisphaeraceae bacterium]